ncbi:MAG: DUF4091 domain-containing protein, partial [Clostridia bacterium]|nr:DUF4091 domain-containing protein [Clostridia bacterium]
TREAPFWVYDVTKNVCDGIEAGRGAFFIRINVALDAPVSENGLTLGISVGGEEINIPVSLKIYNVQIPALSNAEYHMINWIYYDRVARQHNVEPYSEEYMDVMRNYLLNQLDMRNDYLMIPRGEPVRDGEGRVVDFDFSNAEKIGKLALEMGFSYILGGFVIEWKEWKLPELFLLWEKDTEVTTIEAYRQLKLYFTRANELIEKNGWRDCYMQCLMDEPQFNNSAAYRIVAGICRKCIPGVRINDPVESTDLGGALDVWVVKQAVFEKYLEDYKKLQAMGEEIWIYTCGFPANKVMNRVMDLPLTASRLPMWMCYKYGCNGFLHWGYHCHNEEERNDTCYKVREKRFPAGNAHVVYLAEDGPVYSVRGHLQRTGAEDYELLNILGKKDKKTALDIIEKVCRTFDDYEADAAALDNARRELLEAIG